MVERIINPDADSTLESLPAELHHRICAYVDRADIPRLRLVCSTLTTIANEYLMTTTKVSHDCGSLDSVVNGNSRILKGMRKIRFHTGRLHYCPTYADWAHTHRRNTRWYDQVQRESYPERPDSAFEVSEQLKSAYEVYKRLYEDEAALVTDGIIRERFCTLFTLAPRLDTVHLHRNSKTKRKQRSLTYQGGMVDVAKTPDTNPSIHHYEVLTQVLLAARDADRKIKHLSISGLPPSFFKQLPENLAHFGFDLESLESLRLDLGTGGSPTLRHTAISKISSTGVQNLARFMHQCQPVHTLVLKNPSKGHGHWGWTSLQSFVGSSTFTNLTYIHISGFADTQTEFEDLLLRHRLTLRRIHLEKLWLTKGRWRDFFTTISMQFPGIKRGACETNFALRGWFIPPGVFNPTDGDIHRFASVGDGRNDGVGLHGRGKVNAYLFTRRMENYVRDGGVLPSSIQATSELAGDYSEHESDNDIPGGEETDSEMFSVNEIQALEMYCSAIDDENEGRNGVNMFGK